MREYGHVLDLKISAKEFLVRLRRGGDLQTRRNLQQHAGGLQDPGTLSAAKESRDAGVHGIDGLYGLDLALALSEAQGIELMVANPRAVRHFAQALMKRSKNDPIGRRRAGGVLPRAMPFQRWVRPSPTALALRAMTRRLRELVEIQSVEKNRQHAGRPLADHSRGGAA